MMVGCGFPQEKQGMNLGRRAALLAGLPETVPGTTVNRFCASSLQTIRMAFHAISAGEGDAYVAAGVESITQVDGYPKTTRSCTRSSSATTRRSPNVYIPMGLTAENVAERWDVSREDMDRFAQRSQERAVAAQDSGFFAREITPYPKRRDGRRRRRRAAPQLDAEKLAELEPAFKPGGKVTAGNSCPLNDGAAAVVVMSDDQCARARASKPRARIIALDRVGRRAGDHGRRPDRGGAARAPAGGHDDRRRRRHRAERGVRRTGAARLPRARDRPVRRAS